MHKVAYTFDEFTVDLKTITDKIFASGWRPKFVIGLERGGLIPAVFLSHALEIPMVSLKLSLRDHKGISIPESLIERMEMEECLIIDDIYDSGETFHVLKPLVGDAAMANSKTAVMLYNLGAEYEHEVDFVGRIIDKRVNPAWLVFFWEGWFSEFLSGKHGMPTVESVFPK
jgi:hypoxanthine phosphoribosyltransferase